MDKSNKFKCIICGAQIKVIDFTNIITCEYCGNQSIINDQELSYFKKERIKRHREEKEREEREEDLKNFKNYMGSIRYQELQKKYAGNLKQISGLGPRRKIYSFSKLIPTKKVIMFFFIMTYWQQTFLLIYNWNSAVINNDLLLHLFRHIFFYSLTFFLSLLLSMWVISCERNRRKERRIKKY
tara:strand:+ start:26 stop:574 length:549 start_codon:yes stop_codon:yes gene_type:complete